MEEDVANRYYRYIATYAADVKAQIMKTMFVCLLLRLADFEVTDDLLKKMDLFQFSLALNRATLYRRSGIWDTS